MSRYMNYLSIIGNEQIALFWDLKRYWFETTGFLISRTLTVTIFVFGIGQYIPEENFSATLDKTLVAYIVWIFGSLSYYSALDAVRIRGSKGFVQQLFVSSIALERLVLARIMALLLYAIVLTAFLSGLAMLILAHRLEIDYVSLVIVLILSVPSILGVSFVICGFCLQIQKKYITVATLAIDFGLLSTVTLYATNPGFLGFLPFIPGVSLINEMQLHGESFRLELEPLAIVFLNSVIYFLLGKFAYIALENRARVKDLIGRY